MVTTQSAGDTGQQAPEPAAGPPRLRDPGMDAARETLLREAEAITALVERLGRAQRAGAAGRRLRHGPRQDPQLRLRPAADEPAGRQGVQQLVPHAVRVPRQGRADQRPGRPARVLLLLRGLRAVRARRRRRHHRRAGLLPRAVAQRAAHRRHRPGRHQPPRVPVRGREPDRRRQLRRLRAQHPQPAPDRRLELVRRGRRHDLHRRRAVPAQPARHRHRDYFNTAWCPTQEYHAPYHGITLAGGENWSGDISLYRFHIEDPITFTESIRVTIEHGHANKRSDDCSSTAYWYQTLPHRPFGLPPVAQPAAIPPS